MALFLWQHELLCAGMPLRAVLSQTAIPGVCIGNAALYSCTKISSPLSHCSNELIPMSTRSVFGGVNSTEKKKGCVDLRGFLNQPTVLVSGCESYCQIRRRVRTKLRMHERYAENSFVARSDPMPLLHVLQLMSH